MGSLAWYSSLRHQATELHVGQRRSWPLASDRLRSLSTLPGPTDTLAPSRRKNAALHRDLSLRQFAWTSPSLAFSQRRHGVSVVHARFPPAGDIAWAPCWKYMGLTRLYASKKDWSGTQLVDCPSVFGEFVDYTRSLGYTDCPDYAYWKGRFREGADLPAQPFYDPADTGETFPRNTLNAPGSYGRELCVTTMSSLTAGVELPRSARWNFIVPDFIPCSDWPAAFSLDDDELLGNEEEIVCSHLDIVEELPSGQERHVESYCPTEVMHKAPCTHCSEGACAPHKHTSLSKTGGLE
ncbi:hypothetical protein K466DRAFT_635763 [Polyporus arcularius HHB13444]|uniref:Uncharacterized protein n=1 Tax=Polyporus arcularius HHB13444 TaxID=1314778 RepID=A0A5C3PNC0_9APHY|nr:hypothetical protein K466DRAFT_635763 [Polyporus arcularius HHB13444]